MLAAGASFASVSLGSNLHDNGSLGAGPVITVEIDGINANNFIQVDTLQISDTLGQPVTANYTSINDITNDTSQLGDSVRIFFEAQLLFSGTINRKDRGTPDLRTYFNKVEAVDWSYTLIRRKIRRTFTDTSITDIVQSILGTELLSEGFTQGTLDNSTVIMPLVDAGSASNARVFDVLRDIAGATGQTFYVDFDKSIQMRSSSNAVAPLVFDEANVLVENISSLTDRETYRNRQTTVVKGTPAAGIEPNVVTLTVDNAEQIAERQAIEGGTGIYEEFESVTHPTSNDATDLSLLAAGYNILLLSNSGVPRVTIRCRVRSYGIRAGQIATVDLPTFGVSGEYVIQRVTIKAVGGQELFHDIELTSSSAQQRAYEAWLSIVRAGKVIVQIPSAVTTNSQLFTTPGTSTWTVPGGVTVAVFTCKGASGGGGGGASTSKGARHYWCVGGTGGNSGKAVSVRTVVAGQVYDVTVGTAGTGGVTEVLVSLTNEFPSAEGTPGTAGTLSKVNLSGNLIAQGNGGGGGAGGYVSPGTSPVTINDGANGAAGSGTGDNVTVGGGVAGGTRGHGNPAVNGANGANGIVEVNW